MDLPESGAWRDDYRMAQSLGCLPDGWSEDYFQHMLIHQRDFLKAEYQAGPLPIHLDLIAAQDSPAIEPYLGWEQVLPAEQIRLVTVPGGHYELVSAPYVTEVGQAISHAVAQRVESTTNESTTKKQHRTDGEPFDRSYEPLLKLQAGGWDQPVVICIPGAGDNVFSFVELVQSIAPNWTVLALQPRGLWGSGVPHSSVEAAADFYLQVLQTALNYREIHVLGHSFGGWVATELVAKMEAQGVDVASLTIADSRVPTQQPLREYTDVQALGRLIELFEMKGQSIEMTQAQLACLSQPERLNVVHQRLVAKGLMPKNTQVSDLAGIYRVFATNIRTRYTPSALPKAPACLVLASDTSADVIPGWQSLLSDLKVTRSEGNHIMLLKSPYVGVLADMVQGKRPYE
ncbi:alpha/beta fold hydrolase [Vibrio sp. PP-XX7]